MRKPKATKRPEVSLDWDGLIGIAQAQLEQIELKSQQLSALIRFLQSRKAAGEQSPADVLNNSQPQEKP